MAGRDSRGAVFGVRGGVEQVQLQCQAVAVVELRYNPVPDVKDQVFFSSRLGKLNKAFQNDSEFPGSK